MGWESQNFLREIFLWESQNFVGKNLLSAGQRSHRPLTCCKFLAWTAFMCFLHKSFPFECHALVPILCHRDSRTFYTDV